MGGFKKDENGIFRPYDIPSSMNKDYIEAVAKYLNCLDPLFEKSQEKSDFEFILTLLRIRGIQSSREDPYENSVLTFDGFMGLKNKLRGNIRMNLMLWLYGHILESSEPYEIIANLLSICAGGRYRLFNFPKKEYRPKLYRSLYPYEKIEHLDKLSKKANIINATTPIKEFYDRDLRNAIFHANYSVDNGEVILTDPQKMYSRVRTLVLINQALAYHEVIKNLVNSYIESYSESKIIPVSNGFSSDPDEKAIIIVRKGHGVIGLKSTKKGSFYLGNQYSYELNYINKGETMLPKDRVKYWNKMLEKLPYNISRFIEPVVEKYIINR